MKASDQKQLLPHLARVVEAIEEILNSGLTTASEATTQALGVTFQEVSRLKLLRLSSVIRSTHQEINRFVENDEAFSQKRLTFFLNRSWLLCKGIEKAIQEKDKPALNELLWTPPAKKVKSVDVVCLGVVKRIAANQFCAFEFRLRDVKSGDPLTWSCVFPLKKGNVIPAEGFLTLPQKQKFEPRIFTQRSVVSISNLMITENLNGPPRIQLLENSVAEVKEPFEDWATMLQWDIDKAIHRITDHEPSPFDVDIELQEEVVFSNYQIGEKTVVEDPPRNQWELNLSGVAFDLTIPNDPAYESTEKAIEAEKKKDLEGRSLFGIMHYAGGQMIVQPLTLFDHKSNTIDYISLSEKSVDKKAILATLNFR